MNLLKLQQLALSGEKLTMLTCYDASFAALMQGAGVEILLVGDSLGNVIQGQKTTLPVTLEDMEYHTRCVSRGAADSYIVTDLPFGWYQQSPQQAFASAARLMAAGAHMVKVEGGQVMAETVRFLTARGIPVCGHLGLIPQSVHVLGGFRIQGKSEEDAARLLADAQALEAAGAGMVVLELIPADLARRISDALTIPTIGIGAGVHCDGQVLVTYDMLGLYSGKPARFVKNFMQGAGSVQEAISRYVQEVKNSQYPAAEHSY